MRPALATLPLPGGIAGAVVRVHPMVVAEMKAPPSFWDRGAGGARAFATAALTPRSRWLALPIPAFLVEHPGAGPILVDTGFHADVATAPRGHLGRVAGTAYRVTMRPEQALPAQLRARGIEPGDVGLVVLTHLHFDHASGIAQFPGATFVVDRSEWEAASRGGLLGGYAHRLFDHPFDWRCLDFGAPGAEPFAGFERSLDLLGDGSIRLLSTPGHTHGHMSLLCRLAAGDLLLTADAAYARRTIDERLVPLLVGGDEGDYRRSLDQIAGFVEQRPDSEVICGHDPWRRGDLARSYG